MKAQTLGARIRAERSLKHISLREFARQLTIAAPYLVDIEKDRRIPNSELLARIADRLGVPISYFDEFAPTMPKAVREWVANDPLLQKALREVNKTDRHIGDRRTEPSSLVRPVVAIYESELQTIGAETASWVTETGGDLFGVLEDIPTVYLATIAGPDAIRDKAHFRLDVAYLRRLSAYLDHTWGLRYFGDWHSHHRLGLTSPSLGDRNRLLRIAMKNDFQIMAEFIATFARTFDKDRKVAIYPYIYLDLPRETATDAVLLVLKGTSPIREALTKSSELLEQKLEAFTNFPMDKIAIPPEPIGRASGAQGLPIRRISERVLQRAREALDQFAQTSVEHHQTAFGHILMLPTNEHEGVAFAIAAEWPHAVLQVNWIDRALGSAEELAIETSSASVVDIESLKVLFNRAKKLRQGQNR